MLRRINDRDRLMLTKTTKPSIFVLFATFSAAAAESLSPFVIGIMHMHHHMVQ